MMRSASVLLRGRPEDGSPSLPAPDKHQGWGNQSSVRVHTSKGRNTINRSIALGLAMLAVTVIGAAAVNGLYAQNKTPGTYAVLDLSAVNSPDVFEALPSKTGDFDGHTA